MPNKFEPKEKIVLITNPSFQQSIFIYSNKKQKLVIYDTGETSEKNIKRAQAFFSFYNMIWNILRNKKEVINLPKSDLDYK